MTARSVTARNVSFIDLSAGWFAQIVAAKVWFTRAQMPERKCASDLHPDQGITFFFCKYAYSILASHWEIYQVKDAKKSFIAFKMNSNMKWSHQIVMMVVTKTMWP